MPKRSKNNGGTGRKEHHRSEFTLSIEHPVTGIAAELGMNFVRDVTRCSRSTFYDWCTGKHAVPYTAHRLLQLFAFGVIPEPPQATHDNWKHWRNAAFNAHGELIAGNGESFTPTELEGYRLQIQLQAEYKRRIKQLEYQLDIRANPPPKRTSAEIIDFRAEIEDRNKNAD